MQKVAIINDVRGWAYDGITQAIKQYNPDPSLEISLFYQREITDFKRELCRFDLVWPFGLCQAHYCQNNALKDYITSVHMFPLGSMPKRYAKYKHFQLGAGEGAKRLSVINTDLFNFWKLVNPEIYRVIVGVDPLLFHPFFDAPKEHTNLRVGWVGNSTKPYKRFNLIKEATNLPGIELVMLNWKNGKPGIPLPHSEMGNWYRKLDVLLCLSDHEGLPTPMIEAAACGIPMVVTAVGVTEELITNGDNGFIVGQNVAAVQDVLISLRDRSKKERERMSEAACRAIEPWMWPNVIDGWIRFMKGERC